MQRWMVTFIMTAIAFAGALHFPPLWIFVLAIPIWFPYWLQVEEERIHDEAIEHVRARLRQRWKED